MRRSAAIAAGSSGPWRTPAILACGSRTAMAEEWSMLYWSGRAPSGGGTFMNTSDIERVTSSRWGRSAVAPMVAGWKAVRDRSEERRVGQEGGREEAGG